MAPIVSPKRPPLLIAFGLYFLVILPISNIVARAWVKSVSLTDAVQLAGEFSRLEWAILAVSLVVGAGILRVERWAWWLFVFYAPLFATYDAIIFSRNPNLFNVGALLQTIIAFGAVAYFVRRDIYAPFLAEQARGFRDRTRHAITVPIVINGEERTTVDVSEDGCFVLWPQCAGEVGDTVSVDVNVGGEHFVRESAEVARKTPEGIGISFNKRATIGRFRAAVKRL